MVSILGSIFLSIVSILVTIFCIIFVYFKYSFGYWSRKGVPCLPPQFPYGNMKNLILQKQSFGQAVTSLYEKFKLQGAPFAGFYFFSSPHLLIIDPELLKTILTKDFSYFANRGLRIDKEKDPLQGHLLNLRGEKWKAIRQKLTPTFTSSKMKMMLKIILACADEMESVLDKYVMNKEEVDIVETLGRFATDVIGSCAFGLDLNSMNDSESQFRYYGRKCFSPSTTRSFKRTLARFSPGLFRFLNLRLLEDDINDFFTKAISETIEYREKNNIRRDDFLQLLINIKNTGNVDADIGKEHSDGSFQEKSPDQGLSINEIVANSFIFFVAGFETSSSTISYFMYDICMHQDIQDKVRKEINSMLEKYDGQITYEGIMELPYLNKVLNESMRLHSKFPVIDRICTENYNIPNSDVIIEKDTPVAIPLLGLHSDPEYYPDPEKFDPERFSKEEISKRHPFSFLPFGEGPRFCIAKRFGLLQTKVALVKLLKNHRFSLSKRTHIPLKLDATNHMAQVEGGIWIHIDRI